MDPRVEGALEIRKEVMGLQGEFERRLDDAKNAFTPEYLETLERLLEADRAHAATPQHQEIRLLEERGFGRHPLHEEPPTEVTSVSGAIDLLHWRYLHEGTFMQQCGACWRPVVEADERTPECILFREVQKLVDEFPKEQIYSRESVMLDIQAQVAKAKVDALSDLLRQYLESFSAWQFLEYIEAVQELEKKEKGDL